MKERQASSPMTKSSAPAQLDPAMTSRMRVKCSITYPADDHLVRKLLVCFMSFITCFWFFCRCWILCFICIGGANVVQNVAPKPGIDASAHKTSDYIICKQPTSTDNESTTHTSLRVLASTCNDWPTHRQSSCLRWHRCRAWAQHSERRSPRLRTQNF